MFISHPHFYNADPSLVNAVEGLDPSEEQHGLFLDVHPVSEPSRDLPSAQGPAQDGGTLPSAAEWQHSALMTLI